MDKPEVTETKVDEAEGIYANNNADGGGSDKLPPPISVTVIPAPVGAGAGVR